MKYWRQLLENKTVVFRKDIHLPRSDKRLYNKKGSEIVNSINNLDMTFGFNGNFSLTQIKLAQHV